MIIATDIDSMETVTTDDAGHMAAEYQEFVEVYSMVQVEMLPRGTRLRTTIHVDLQPVRSRTEDAEGLH